MTYHLHRRLNPAFQAVVLNSDMPRHLQALLAGFGHPSHLSNLLHTRRRIPLTPKTKGRFEALAKLTDYTGEIFLAEPFSLRSEPVGFIDRASLPAEPLMSSGTALRTVAPCCR